METAQCSELWQWSCLHAGTGTSNLWAFQADAALFCNSQPVHIARNLIARCIADPGLLEHALQRAALEGIVFCVVKIFVNASRKHRSGTARVTTSLSSRPTQWYHCSDLFLAVEVIEKGSAVHCVSAYEGDARS